MLVMTFEAIAPVSDTQGVKEWIAMVLEEIGCRDIRCTEVHEDVEQMRIRGEYGTRAEIK